MRSLLAAIAVVLLATTARSAIESAQTLAGTVPTGLAGLRQVGPVAPDTPIEHVTVYLGLRDRALLNGIVAAQQDPRSPRFRRWLDAEEIADRFGARRTRYERVRRWLADQGLQVVGDSPFRVAVVASGTAAQVESALRTPLALVRRNGRVYRAPLADPTVPADLGIRGILGLDDLPAFRPLVRLGDGTLTMSPQDFARVYGVEPLWAAGLHGAGTSIAVIARSDFLANDLTLFGRQFTAVPPRPVVKVFADGTNPGVLTDPGEEIEVLLDSQWAGALAPEADVRVVIGSRSGNIPAALARAVAERIGDLITISFGLCEALNPRVASELFDGYYALANLQGQTVLVASGDAGATDCAPDLSDVSVNALASSPHAIAVGGTSVDPLFAPDTGAATGVGSEVVWSDDSGAGGGGLSDVFARPLYQFGIGPFMARALPDLSLAASPTQPGYVVVRRGHSIPVGGTSAGAPALASILALVNERAGGGGLGQLLPTLYRLGHESASGARPSVFRDIVAGSNGFAASAGFDLASGWGAPIAETLTAGIVDAPRGPCEPALGCLVPAAGSRRRSCMGQWLVEHAALARTARGLPARRQVCRDGDPACDQDRTADGRCTINVALCVNVVDARTVGRDGLPLCATSDVRRVRLLAPARRRSGAGRQARSNLAAALRSLPELPTRLDDGCTATVPVVVPVGGNGASGRMMLKAQVRGARRSARPRVELACLAR